jgi:hypothetical protein
MADEKSSTVPAVPSEVPSTVTVTFYEQLAQQFNQVLDQLMAIAPPVPDNEVANAEQLLRRGNVPIPFLSTTVVWVERIPALQAVRKLDVQAARDTLQYIDAFRPVLDRMAASFKRLGRSLKTRKAALAVTSLQIYDIAKGLDRDSKDPEIAAAVANMQRDLGKRGRTPVPASVRNAAKAAAKAGGTKG